MFMKYHIAVEKSFTKMLGTLFIQRFTQKIVRPISEKRIEERLLYQKSNSKDWDPSAIEKFKQSRFYPFRLCLRKIGLPLLIMLYVAIWIGLAIFK